jgi:hypothetical protein
MYRNSKKVSIAVKPYQSLPGNALVPFVHSLFPSATPERPPPSGQAMGCTAVVPVVVVSVLCGTPHRTGDRSYAGMCAHAVTRIDAPVASSACCSPAQRLTAIARAVLTRETTASASTPGLPFLAEKPRSWLPPFRAGSPFLNAARWWSRRSKMSEHVAGPFTTSDSRSDDHPSDGKKLHPFFSHEGTPNNR